MASEKPNSKIGPVTVANADWLPVSSRSHTWRPSRTAKRRTAFGLAVENSTPPSIPSARSRHVFVSPGAIRFVASVSGKPASTCSVALSHVSQRRGRAVGAGALADDVLQHRVDTARLPAEPQRQVQHVHAEVVHHPELAAEPRLALPVD